MAFICFHTKYWKISWFLVRIAISLKMILGFAWVRCYLWCLCRFEKCFIFAVVGGWHAGHGHFWWVYGWINREVCKLSPYQLEFKAGAELGNLLPSSFSVEVPVKFNWTEIVLLSVSDHPPTHPPHPPGNVTCSSLRKLKFGMQAIFINIRWFKVFQTG